jgi:two-component system sensor kinase FixL
MVHLSRSIAMGILASALAHELAQPIGAAANFLGAAQLARGAQGETNQSLVDEALRHAARSLERASDILVSIRAISTKRKVSLSRQNLELLIYEALQLLPPDLDTEIEVNAAPMRGWSRRTGSRLSRSC